MTRITAEHLSGETWVCVRQSTPDQVRHNWESRGRQYGLEGRARELGWREVVVVDDDLGQSGKWRHSRHTVSVSLTTAEALLGDDEKAVGSTPSRRYPGTCQ